MVRRLDLLTRTVERLERELFASSEAMAHFVKI